MAVTPLDLCVLAAIIAFAAWGAWRGPVRPLLGLGLIALAAFVAGRLAGPLAPTAARVFGPGPAEAEALAWAAAAFATLVVGGAVLAVISPWLRERESGMSFLGGVLGVLLGVAWIVVAFHAVAALEGGAAQQPSLSRDTRAPARADTGPFYAGARSAAGAAVLGGALREYLELPAALDARLDRASASLVGEAN